MEEELKTECFEKLYVSKALSYRKSRADRFNEKVKKYHKNQSDYDLLTKIEDVNNFSNRQWYKYVGENFCNASTDEIEDVIDVGKKRVKDYIKILEEWGIDFEKYDFNIENNSGKNNKLDLMKLITFIIEFCSDEKVKLKMLLENPSMENMEYLSDEEWIPYNSELMTILYMVIASMVDITYVKNLSKCFAILISTGQELEENVINYLNIFNCDINALETVKQGVVLTVEKIEERESKNEFIEFKSLFEEMLIKIYQHYVQAVMKDVIEVSENIAEMKIEKKSVYGLEQLILDNLTSDEIVPYAKGLRNSMSSMLGITKKKYDSIVNNLLGKYVRILSEDTKLNGVHVLAMIHDIAYQMDGKVEKEILKYYRYRASDMQKTIKAALRNDDTQIKMQMVIAERINRIYYTYLGREKEYLIYLEISVLLNKNILKVCRCKNVSEINNGIKIMKGLYQMLSDFLLDLIEMNYQSLAEWINSELDKNN